MSDNYAVINGKRIKLTYEQVKTLGIERKNPFERVEEGRTYYYVNESGNVDDHIEIGDSVDDGLKRASNYFIDKDFAKQVALHQLLYRKLLKYAHDNECEDASEWDGSNPHWVIRYDEEHNTFTPDWYKIYKTQGVYFSSEDGANGAIKEVVEPFVKEYPDFVW